MLSSSLTPVPPARCPHGCSSHGTCYAHIGQDDFPALCLCREHWGGLGCEIRQANPFRTKTRDRPHWPELLTPDKLQEHMRVWYRKAGVSCGGG